MSKLISTFKIGFDDETKAVLSELKDKLDAIKGSLGVPSALLGSTKPNGGLLVAMGDAANDAPESELKQMGQWVFEGQDKKWASAHVDQDGQGFLCTVPKSMTIRADGYWTTKYVGWRVGILDGEFDASDWENSAIDRETVNDVDYLSETVPEIEGMEASDIIIDDMGRDYSHNSNCLHAVVPHITQADMQLIFIKNLSDVLIQRMHSMGRFSHDDYVIGGQGGDVMMPWDIVYDIAADRFGLITASEKEHHSAFFFKPLSITVDTPTAFHKDSLLGGALRTITEDEVSNFRGVLEARYA
ncbi:hypothetical protein EI164_05095 [Psychrobacter sp. FME13]|uniref:hypothetical protein n=1 Tax=Psychrobacter sp. FME13 TaxID=2487708 RepID=UPI001787C03B|nr:hypothetical protein [Psychrobacter sp. FME13]MBE0441442.1 hypothetical protein [Psychrobacter sp. FME13]